MCFFVGPIVQFIFDVKKIPQLYIFEMNSQILLQTRGRPHCSKQLGGDDYFSWSHSSHGVSLTQGAGCMMMAMAMMVIGDEW